MTEKNAMMGGVAESAPTVTELYDKVVERVQSNPRLQRLVSNHIRDLSGHSTIANYHANGGNEAEKREVYSACLDAMAANDFTMLKSKVDEIKSKRSSTGDVDTDAVGDVIAESGAFIPTLDPTFVISDQTKGLLDLIIKLSEDAPQNVLATGSPGCGKTSLGIQMAALHKRPVLMMDCQNIREPRDWFGHKTAEAGTVFWRDARFVEAVEKGNHVIILDEINRTAPHVNNTLHPLLDERRFTYVEERRNVVKVGKGTVFFATMNIGLNFTGTAAFDDALEDRFTRRIEVQYLTVADEVEVIRKRTGLNKADAKRIVEVGDAIRKKAVGFGGSLTRSVSTRRLVDAARDFKHIGPQALEYAISNHFSNDSGGSSDRAQVLQIIQGKFPPGVV